MAAKINISKLLSQISAFGHDANRLAVAVTNETAQGMVTQAQLRVTSNNSIDKGQLRLSIGKTTARVGYNRFILYLLIHLMLLMLSSVLVKEYQYLKDLSKWQLNLEKKGGNFDSRCHKRFARLMVYQRAYIDSSFNSKKRIKTTTFFYS
jgi:hypothetical protein